MVRGCCHDLRSRASSFPCRSCARYTHPVAASLTWALLLTLTWALLLELTWALLVRSRGPWLSTMCFPFPCSSFLSSLYLPPSPVSFSLHHGLFLIFSLYHCPLLALSSHSLHQFGSWSLALFTLFQVSSGDGWVVNVVRFVTAS